MLCCTLNGLYVRGVRALRGTGRVFVSTSFSAFSVFCMCRRRGRLSYGSGRLPPPELGGRLALFSKDVRWYPASPCVCARFCQLVTDIRGCPPRLPRSPPLCRLHHASSRQYPAATSTARQPPPTSTASSGAYMFGPLAHARLQRGCTTTTSTWPNFVRFHPTGVSWKGLRGSVGGWVWRQAAGCGVGVAAGELAAWGTWLRGAIVDGNARQQDMRGRNRAPTNPRRFSILYSGPSSCIRRLFLYEYKKGTREDERLRSVKCHYVDSSAEMYKPAFQGEMLCGLPWAGRPYPVVCKNYPRSVCSALKSWSRTSPSCLHPPTAQILPVGSRTHSGKVPRLPTVDDRGSGSRQGAGDTRTCVRRPRAQ